jgi:glycosyltransferase involved in cell wall biosynthesis
MPPTWRARWPDPRLEFAGFAGSIAQVHAASTVFVAPLRAGGGSKLKVLEAMASGMPVVSTQQGLTGLNVLDGVHALHGETATELAAALVCCLREPVMATALGERARQLVAREHDWNAIGDELERIYRTYLCTAVGAPPGWGGRRP